MRSRRGWLPTLAASLALATAAAPAATRAQPATGADQGGRPGPFMAASLGGGEVGDAPPGLTGGGLGLGGHLEVGYGDGRFVSGAVSVLAGRTSYDNNVPPPEMVQPASGLSVTRIGLGAVGEGSLPLGRVTTSLGLGTYLERVKASASGSLAGVHGNYFEASDVGIGFEARAGLDLRVHNAVLLGLRAGWSWSRADLDALTSGEARWLSGPWIELRVAFDASGFRMASAAPP